MSDLTVTEKQFWQERIRTEFMAVIEQIEVRYAAVLEQARTDARAQAISALGLSQTYQELDVILLEESALAKRRRRVLRSMVAILEGVPYSLTATAVGFNVTGDHGLPYSVFRAINTRSDACQKQTMTNTPAGQALVNLRELEHDLVNRLWLSRSTTDVEPIWKSATEQLELVAPFLEPYAESQDAEVDD
jgi:hypothetical protein